MTAPDMNVRPARSGSAGNANATGASCLARLLLVIARPLSKLDRRFLPLLFAASLSPACIIPVAPEFQDPPGNPNAPPQILTPDPFWGAEESTTADKAVTFTMVVTDVNVEDTLHVRVFIDGTQPLNDFASFKSSTGQPLHASVPITVGCGQISDKTRTRHTILAAVADRDFADNPNDLLAVMDGGVATPIPWTLNVTCQAGSP
jgi:hypothetical protein